MSPVNLLVLGVGGNVSQSILKALAVSGLPHRVVGACVSPLAAGLFAVDRAYVSPPAADPSFVGWLFDVCRREQIRGVLSGVEPVLDVLAAEATRLTAETGAVPVVSPPALLALCNDKLLTSRWLERHGLAFARSADATDRGEVEALVRDCGYPLVAKPRGGKGGAGITVVRSDEQLAAVLAAPAGLVLQEHLGRDDQEYTVATFTDRCGAPRGAIAMRRHLQHGTTVFAEAGRFPEVRRYALAVTAALRPAGPCNVQLRMTERGPVCFEINLRFSGTTALRARFGFNDVAAAVTHFVLGAPAPELPDVVSGIGLRYWNEIYVDPAAVSRLTTTGRLLAPRGAVQALDSLEAAA